MRDLDELRRAMVAATSDLVPQTGAEQALQSGRRRRARRRAALAGGAGVAIVALAVPVALWSRGDGGSATVAASSSPSPARVVDPGCPTSDPLAAPPVGDTIWLGVTDSAGNDLMARLIGTGSPGVAGFAVGLGDRATGTVEGLGCVYAFPVPPVAAGHPKARSEFDAPGWGGPEASTTVIGTFVGPVDRVTASYDGRPLSVRFVRSSAYPDLVVYWVTGVPANRPENPRGAAHPLVTFYDATGTVLANPPR